MTDEQLDHLKSLLEELSNCTAQAAHSHTKTRINAQEKAERKIIKFVQKLLDEKDGK